MRAHRDVIAYLSRRVVEWRGRGVAGARKWSAGVVTLAVCMSWLTGCAKPDYNYAQLSPSTAPAGNVYFKVPQGWTQFTADDISKAESSWSADPTAKNLLAATAWQDAYDADPRPSLIHVLGTQTPQAPTVFASLRTVFQAESDGATTAALRDMVVPLSTLGSNVHILTDDKISQGPARGVHVVFSYVPAAGGPEETVDQTALLSGGKGAVYLLLVRCSSECYTKNRDAIHSVTASYTIQEDPNG